MRQQDIFKKIGHILQELNEQYEYLKTQGDNIDDLELELLAANSHFLSDHLEILRKLNATLIKSLPAHVQTTVAEAKPAAEQPPETKVIEEPALQLDGPETIAGPPVALIEEPVEPEVTEPEPVIELPALFADEATEAEPTPAGYFQTETEPYAATAGEEAESEAAPQPGGGFHFDFETVPQVQEDADEYTSKQFQHQPEEAEQAQETAPIIDEETEDVIEAETEYRQEEPPVTPYSFQVPATAPPVPGGQAYQHEESVAEKEEPTHSFEPVVSPIEINDSTAPEIDIKPDTGNDMFSFMRTAEPQTIHHELTPDETAGAPDDKDEAENINSTIYYKEPETTPVPPKPEPAAIPTYQLNQTPPPAPVAEPERPLTLNERLSANAAVNNTAASAAPIKDLKSAITLNDKMLFVRDLFNGYSLAYSEAIEILNRFSNFEDAERFLNTNYVEKNHWADKPATNDKFFDLLKRRFA